MNTDELKTDKEKGERKGGRTSRIKREDGEIGVKGWDRNRRAQQGERRSGKGIVE